MKVTKRTVNREITLEEFIKMKGVQPFKGLRQNAKSLNFLCIFGGSQMVFAEEALETKWTRDECLKFIEDNHCQEEVRQTKEIYKGISDEELPFVAVATRLRNRFFEGYPGLMKRIKAEQDYGKKHGFIRSPFGNTRKLIELKYCGEWDKKTQGGMIRNLNNICSNTAIQGMEASISKRAMYEMMLWLRKNNLESYLFSEIHDSNDLVVKKSELKEVISHMKNLCERYLPEFPDDKIILKVDCEVSDLTQGDYYKGGREPIEFGVDWDNIEKEPDEVVNEFA